MTIALLLALSAPAPLPRPPAPVTAKDLAGRTFTLVWNGGRGACRLHAGGAWECEWGGSLWVGTWSFRGGTLAVRERCPAGDAPWSWFSWEARLRRVGGAIRGDGVRLERGAP
jgi:hypothetical protein